MYVCTYICKYHKVLLFGKGKTFVEESIGELSIRSFWQWFSLHIINSFGYQCAARTYIFFT